MLPHNYIVEPRRADRARVAARAPTTSCSRRCRCSTSTRSRCASSARCSSAGSAAIERQFSVSNFWPEVKRTGATMVSMLGSLAILIANADDHPDQAGHQLRLCAAAPMPPDTDRIWRERFGCKTFSGGYGLTEASLDLDARRGRAEQARRGGQAEPARVRRAPRRRRRRRGRGRRGRRDRVPAQRPEPDVRGLLEPARRDGRGDAQPLVPHRRPRPARRRRLPLLRRPQEGRAAPPGREHLELRDGEDVVRPRGDHATSRCTRCRATSARTT